MFIWCNNLEVCTTSTNAITTGGNCMPKVNYFVPYAPHTCWCRPPVNDSYQQEVFLELFQPMRINGYNQCQYSPFIGGPHQQVCGVYYKIIGTQDYPTLPHVQVFWAHHCLTSMPGHFFSELQPNHMMTHGTHCWSSKIFFNSQLDWSFIMSFLLIISSTLNIVFSVI